MTLTDCGEFGTEPPAERMENSMLAVKVFVARVMPTVFGIPGSCACDFIVFFASGAS